MSNAIADLNRLADALADLSDVPSRAARGAAERINGMLAEEFASAHSADGEPWAPLMASTIRRKGGDARILIRSGETRDNTYARPLPGSGIEISSTEAAGYHQSGTSNMVARPILPDTGELPPEWEEAIDDEVAKAFGRAK